MTLTFPGSIEGISALEDMTWRSFIKQRNVLLLAFNPDH
jgi:hypothetical protein